MEVLGVLCDMRLEGGPLGVARHKEGRGTKKTRERETAREKIAWKMP